MFGNLIQNKYNDHCNDIKILKISWLNLYFDVVKQIIIYLTGIREFKDLSYNDFSNFNANVIYDKTYNF